MSAITFRHPAESGSYRPFRDEAVSRQVRQLERFQFRRNHTNERALRLKSSTGSVKVGIALILQPGLCVVLLRRRHGHVEPEQSRGLG